MGSDPFLDSTVLIQNLPDPTQQQQGQKLCVLICLWGENCQKTAALQPPEREGREDFSWETAF